MPIKCPTCRGRGRVQTEEERDALVEKIASGIRFMQERGAGSFMIEDERLGMMTITPGASRRKPVALPDEEAPINPCRRCGAEARRIEVSEKWTRIECTGCDAKTADYYWPHGGDPREEWNKTDPTWAEIDPIGAALDAAGPQTNPNDGGGR